MSTIILKATNVCKNYFSPTKVTVLSGINLELHKGEAIAIQGASGEGKTTLLHILGALERPCSGSITVNEKLISFKDYSKTRNSLFGFIFQTYNLLEDLTVLDNVIMPAVIARKKPSKIYDHGKLLLQEVGLLDRQLFLAKLLSGGEKQRVAIARSFCNDPEIILADEPSGNLDHGNSKIIHELLISFVKKKNKSLLVVTHDEELAGLCDKRFLLKEGLLHNI